MHLFTLYFKAIALETRQVDARAAMEAVTRGPGGGANYIVGRVMNQVSRSRYGRRAVQNMTREIKDARNLIVAASTWSRMNYGLLRPIVSFAQLTLR
jgi:hypothetical protein